MAKSTKPARAQALSPARYKQLRHDVQQLVSRADALSQKKRVTTLWKLGQRIQRERVAQGAGYHNTVLRDLCRDTRVSLRNLQYAVAFARAYLTLPKDPLSWGHYRLLLDRPNAEQRNHYEARTRKENLAVHALARLISDDQRKAQPDSPLLPRPTDASYLYKANVESVIDGDTLDLSVDLGFHTARLERFRLANINTPELSPTNDEATEQQARAARDHLYNRIQTAATIVVKTQRTDQHGRYVAHVFYTARDVAIDECFRDGTYLNAEMIEAGFAVRVE